MNKTSKLSFGNSKDCFLSLSEDLISDLKTSENSVFEISSTDARVFVTWSGQQCQGQSIAMLNGLLADKQKLQNNDEILIRPVRDAPSCLRVYVEPLSIDDWEILEMHAGFVEANLLNQIRVVSRGLIFPVWINKSICIFVKTGDIDPAGECALLEQRTEVVITPKDRRGPAAQTPARVPSTLKNQPTPNGNTVRGKESLNTKESNTHENRTKPATTKATKKTRFSDEDQEMIPEPDMDPEPQSLFGSMVNFVTSWWRGDTSESNSTFVNRDKFEFLSEAWKAGLRVQQIEAFLDANKLKLTDKPLLDIKPIEITLQPTNVYISRRTFESNFKFSTQNQIASSFLACLAFLPSPSQKEQIVKKKMEKSSHKLPKSSAPSQLPVSGDEGSCDHQEDKTSKVVVRVIVLDHGKLYRLLGENQVEMGRAQLGGEFGVLDDHVMMSDQLRRQLSVDVTGRVLVTSLHNVDKPCESNSLQLHPLFERPEGFTDVMLVSAFKSWLLNCSDARLPLIVHTGALISVPLKTDFEGEFLLSFQPETPSRQDAVIYIGLQPHLVEKMRITVTAQITGSDRPAWLSRLPCLSTRQFDPDVPSVCLDTLGGINDLAESAMNHIEYCLAQRPLVKSLSQSQAGIQNGGLLICGPRGVGRTTLAKGLCKKLSQSPNYASCGFVECKNLRGKRVDSILKALERVFTEAAWRQPSIVVLDDLDTICASPSGPEQEMGGDALYFSKVAQVLRDLLKIEINSQTHMCVVATCSGQSSLHASLAAPQGLHFFQHAVHIKPPDKVQREDILRCLIQSHKRLDDELTNQIDLTTLASKTEGYVARDLEQVLQRALHTHIIFNPDTSSKSAIKLTQEDINIALEGFAPASLKNVNLHSPAEVGWSSVGGLHDVRHALVETLQWPAKYPELFANCPLRLRSGLLLYGAPGTGKTLLASVVAKECGLNFISIKGPELLSKYIGASEQAVRDTFLRAQSAKPCILFFDEFDSLAPRRGHDSTGVTDRVVNQLLTQLDGVEGLDGVYMLAATSRPDLIDPALLRPGRLDKALHCTLPNQEERGEILTSLTRHMTLSRDVNLEELANQCTHFTGADFKALLYNAQLSAIHEQHGLDLGGIGNTEVTSQSSDVTQRAKNSDSETSVASTSSNGSWEALSVPKRESSEAVILEHPRPTRKPLLTYFPNLEEGVSEIPEEMEQTLREQVSSVMLGSASKPEKQEQSQNASVVVIHSRHLQSALATTGPSVSDIERAKFEAIYAQFVSSRGSNFTEMTKTAGKRATLA